MLPTSFDHGVVGVTGGPSGSAYAGFFQGNVYVSGTLSIGGTKSAVVLHADGSHRRVYCQESPEPWFEDFGKGQLVGGRATVRLDADFAALVKTDDYGVFPVPEGDCNGLYVTSKTPQGFEVRELRGGSVAVGFSYRVVARRKDVPGVRLERFTPPPPADLKALPVPRVPAAGQQQQASPAPASAPTSSQATPTPTPTVRPTATTAR